MKADVVILGAGSGGEMLASLLGAKGISVAIIEENLVGGECPFYACMPSKAMLRSAAIRFYAQHTMNVGASSIPLELDNRKKAFAAAVNRREEICDNHKDNANEQNLVDLGVKVIRGHGHIDSPGVVKVASQEIHYTDLVISTGSVPHSTDSRT
jgi:pyruvate/2-oxoglutarate dehydrogenase complex dihydrolipoamide dehydrogenase (E3) component